MLARALLVVSFVALWGAFLWAAAGPLAAQQTPQDSPEVRDVRLLVQDVSRALQAGNAASFLHWFDRERFAQYPALESHVVALTTQSDVASSIQFLEIERVQDGYRLRVDWLLQVSLKETPAPLEARHQVIQIEAREQGKGKWRISGLEPVDFFRPQGAGQDAGR